jgi:hypothetical protein
MLLGKKRIDQDGVAPTRNKRDGIDHPSEVLLAGRNAWRGNLHASWSATSNSDLPYSFLLLTRLSFAGAMDVAAFFLRNSCMPRGCFAAN